MWCTGQSTCAVSFLSSSVRDVDVDEEENKDAGMRVQKGGGIG